MLFAGCLVPVALGEQLQVFADPIGFKYGSGAVRAPMKTAVSVHDWDRDGDPDLLANGWWWQEFDRTAAGEPIYRRGGRSGPVYHVGDLDGDDHLDAVTIRGGRFIWLEDTANEGSRKFEEQSTLPFVLGGPLKTPDSQGIIDVFMNWKVCGLGDIDNDGLTDLLVQRLQCEQINGDDGYAPWEFTDHGTGWIDDRWVFNTFDHSIWWHRNVGTRTSPAFTLARLVEVGPAGLGLTFPWRSVTATPIDWNADGRTDVFVQVFDYAVVFLNIGVAPNGEPRFDTGRRVRFGDADRITHRKAGVPYRDADGQLRILFHGGSVVYEARQNDPDDPFAFTNEQWVLFENPSTANLDIFSVPDVADWDGDGRLDLIVGSEVGFIWWLRNLDPDGGTKRWDAPALLEADNTPIRLDRHFNMQGPEEFLIGYSNPTAEDWDLDGDLDLVVGCHGETYYLFENVGSSTEPRLTARGPLQCGTPARDVEVAWRTRPGVGDITGDGLPDLIGADEERRLCYWPRVRDSAGRLTLGERETAVDVDGYPFLITRPSRGLGRSKFVVLDWDGDGRQDIISSSQLGDRDKFIFYFRNSGERNGKPTFEFHPRKIEVGGHVASNRFTHFNMLEPVDFNGDGVWEGLAGMDMRHPSIPWTWLFYWPQMRVVDADEHVEQVSDAPVGWPDVNAVAAEMIPAVKQGAVDQLAPGKPVFRNRPWRVEELPEQLRGKRYVRGDIEMGFSICTSPGIVYVIAPEPDGTRHDAYRQYFQSIGFTLCSQESFILVGGDKPQRAWALWKNVELGEKIAFGKWAVVAF